MPREVRVFVPEKFSVICLINLGLNRLSGVLVDVVELNDVEEAIGIRVGPELFVDKSIALGFCFIVEIIISCELMF